MPAGTDDEVRAERRRRAAQGRGAWRRYAGGRDLVAELIAERRAAAAAEQADVDAAEPSSEAERHLI